MQTCSSVRKYILQLKTPPSSISANKINGLWILLFRIFVRDGTGWRKGNCPSLPSCSRKLKITAWAKSNSSLISLNMKRRLEYCSSQQIRKKLSSFKKGTEKDWWLYKNPKEVLTVIHRKFPISLLNSVSREQRILPDTAKCLSSRC